MICAGLRQDSSIISHLSMLENMARNCGKVARARDWRLFHAIEKSSVLEKCVLSVFCSWPWPVFCNLHGSKHALWFIYLQVEFSEIRKEFSFLL